MDKKTDKLFLVGRPVLIVGFISPYLTIGSFFLWLPPAFIFSLFFGIPCFIIGLIMIWLSNNRTSVKLLFTLMPLLLWIVTSIFLVIAMVLTPGFGAPH